MVMAKRKNVPKLRVMNATPNDQINRHCIPDSAYKNILLFCHDHACGGHFIGRKLLQKFCSVISIGPLCFVMLMPTVNLVIVVNDWTKLHDLMKWL